MKIQYDKVANALYIYLKKGKIQKTKEVAPGILVDIGRGNSIIGLEILGPVNNS